MLRTEAIIFPPIPGKHKEWQFFPIRSMEMQNNNGKRPLAHIYQIP